MHNYCDADNKYKKKNYDYRNANIMQSFLETIYGARCPL